MLRELVASRRIGPLVDSLQMVQIETPATIKDDAAKQVMEKPAQKLDFVPSPPEFVLSRMHRLRGLDQQYYSIASILWRMASFTAIRSVSKVAALVEAECSGHCVSTLRIY